MERGEYGWWMGEAGRRHLITFRKQKLKHQECVLVMSQGKMLCLAGFHFFLGLNPFTEGHTLEERNLAALNFSRFYLCWCFSRTKLNGDLWSPSWRCPLPLPDLSSPDMVHFLGPGVKPCSKCVQPFPHPCSVLEGASFPAVEINI